MIRTFVKRIWLAVVISVLFFSNGLLSLGSMKWDLEAKKNRNVITVAVRTKNPVTIVDMDKVRKTYEKKIKTVKGIDYFSSVVDAHKVYIEIFFKQETNSVDAIKEISNIIVTAKRPDFVKIPEIQRSSKNDQPIVVANVYSERLPLSDITRYAKEVILPKFEKIDGISYVEIKGDSKKEIQLKLKEDKVSYFNIPMHQIRRSFDVYNKEKGFISRQTGVNEFAVVANSSIHTIEDIRNMYVDFTKGIKLSDIADIEFSQKDFLNENWVNGTTRVVSIKVFKTSEGNPLEASNQVMKILKSWEKKHSLVMQVEDNSQGIRDFFKKIKKTFIEALIIVILVVVVFLGSFQASITPLLAIPVSLIATLFFMKITDCSINVSTLMAFLLAIGLVVDDAILVVENITKHYIKNKNLHEAAIKGTEEIQVSIIVMTLTLACVFFPAILSKGTFGATLREFAITLAVSVIISGVLSLTLTPSISARLLSHSSLADKIMYPIEKSYNFLLKQALKLRHLLAVFAAFTIISSGMIVNKLPKESSPSVELREFDIYSVNSGNKHLEFFKSQARVISKYLKAHPDIANFVIYMDSNISLDIKLKKEGRSVLEIKNEILKFLDKNIPDVEFVTKSTKSGTSFDVYIYGNTTRSEMSKLGREFSGSLRKSQYIDNAIQYATSKVGYKLCIDYQKAAAIGCDIETVEKVIELLNQRFLVSTLDSDGKKYNIVSVTEKHQDINKALRQIWNETKQDKVIKISPMVFSNVVKEKQTTSYNNFNGLPAFRLEVSGQPGVKMGDLVKNILNIHKKSVGHSTEIAFTGKAKEFLQDQGEMQKMFGLAAIFIFLILLAQFESLKCAFIVLMTAPLAIWGSLIAIKAKGSINIYSTIAMITLIGLITKHGILFVNTANQYLAEGRSKEDATYYAATDRLRPVLMTTLAMTLGLVPLMFEKDNSMIKLVQMVNVLVPGLTIGTLTTLFVIPSLFLLF